MPVPGARAAAACQWSFIPTPNATLNNGLSAIGADAPTDVWTVGFDQSTDSVYHPLVERWSGSGWTVVPGPTPAGGGWLAGIAAFSPSNVWSAGSQYVNLAQQALVEHWNGHALAIEASPNLGASSFLDGISGSSRNDIWAVGGFSAQAPPLNQTLVEHWNGRVWTVVPSPNADANSNQLISVSAASPSDVWAAGYYTDTLGVFRTMTERWNGNVWTIVPSANPSGSSDDELHGIAVIAPNDVWAVGTYSSSGGPQRALVEHWNGHAWRVVHTANIGTEAMLFGVSATSTSDVWAVGSIYTSAGNRLHPLVEHWDGTAWSIVASPDDGNQPILEGVDALSVSDVWSAGAFVSNGNTLVEGYGCSTL